mmetsp:Transcript_14683/g.41773  ORF Transcript_14683/g.41773 Transcript_14683/m.41773 type:complete len:908 (-) Transcript_14683:200-2923(-)|eukprot:CAMPEP_0119126860 /NCGR_PEP_ID=MMETSP1310-20130426/5619_1 /TAXON_ID=464262 /ORGANISM="Genus nov. species nov., Strain RCC2339" /LENGTH=907 /DNA_ID=CAMNT_0007117053 /DNA_START=173 /DNA_END=2899 /DNA_ORIENTATION=-
MLKAKKAKTSAGTGTRKGWGRKGKKTKVVANAKFDPDNPTLPPLFLKSVAYLEQRGLEVEGIFRVSGSVARVKALKERFDKGENVDLDSIMEPHCVSGCLKLFLRELTDPVCTFELYDCFLAASSVSVRESRISCLRKVIELLPPGNFRLLKLFCGLLKKIHDHAAVNMMKASNLSIVFSPTLLRAENETEQTMVSDMNTSNMLVEQFIVDYEEIFLGKEVVPGDDEELGDPEDPVAMPPPLPEETEVAGEVVNPLSQSDMTAPSKPADPVPNKFRRQTAAVPPTSSRKDSRGSSQLQQLSPADDALNKSQTRRKAMILTGDIQNQIKAQQSPKNSVMIVGGGAEQSPLAQESTTKDEAVSEPEPLCFVRGLWDFEAELEDELTFNAGTEISVTRKDGDKEGFWFGRFYESAGGDTSVWPTANHTTSREGWFQNNFVEEIPAPPKPEPEAPEGWSQNNFIGVIPAPLKAEPEEEEVPVQADAESEGGVPAEARAVEEEAVGYESGATGGSAACDGGETGQEEAVTAAGEGLEEGVDAVAAAEQEEGEDAGKRPGSVVAEEAEGAAQTVVDEEAPAAAPTAEGNVAGVSNGLASSGKAAPPRGRPPLKKGLKPKRGAPPTGAGPAKRLVCRAKWDFTPPADKSSLLEFRRGDVIIVRRAGKEQGWWLGQLNGQSGHFPVSYTEKIYVDVNAGKAPSEGASAGGSESEEFNRMLSIAKKRQTVKLSQEQLTGVGTVSGRTASARASDPGATSTSPEAGRAEEEPVAGASGDDHVAGAGTESEGEAGGVAENGVPEAQAQANGGEEEEATEEEEEEDEEGGWNEPATVVTSAASETSNVPEPLESVNDGGGDWVEALYAYEKSPDTPELTFDVGAKMKVLRRFPGGWMEAMLDGQKGFIPGTYVTACDAP